MEDESHYLLHCQKKTVRINWFQTLKGEFAELIEIPEIEEEKKIFMLSQSTQNWLKI